MPDFSATLATANNTAQASQNAMNESGQSGMTSLALDDGTKVILPLPTEIDFGASYGWSAQETGAQSDVGDFLMGQAGGAELASGVAKRIGLAIAGKVASTAQSYGAINQVANPREKAIFEGVRLRSFSLSFNIASKYKEKMKARLYMLNALYRAAAPGLAEGESMFTVPPMGVLSIMDNNRKIVRDRDVVITGLNTNFTPDGAFNTFVDGTPIHFLLQISFLETQLPTKITEMNVFGDVS